jgi:hypothetical protein
MKKQLIESFSLNYVLKKQLIESSIFNNLYIFLLYVIFISKMCIPKSQKIMQHL